MEERYRVLLLVGLVAQGTALHHYVNEEACFH